MRTLRIELEFDGSDFDGWQRQADARTVQGEVEAALTRILGEPHTVVGCGRTDAGVHARGLIASFRTPHAMDVGDLDRALDAVLPDDIGVVSLREADPAFHAQRDAAWKWYRYTVLVSRRKRPLLAGRVWRVPSAPPLESLQRTAKAVEGTHDFASFANSGSSPGRTTVRTLFKVRVTAEDERLFIDVVGDGFLYKMVRTLVGTLLEVAGATDPVVRIGRILDARDRREAGRAAPGRGLCLMAVGVRGDTVPSRVPLFLVPDVESMPRR